MVTRLAVIVLPSVQVQVLDLGMIGQPPANVHVVQGLAVLVKQVRVALDRGKTSDLVGVKQARLGGKGLNGLDLRKLVEVAGGDDASLGVLGEDPGDEVLRKRGEGTISPCPWGTRRGQVHIYIW